MMKMTARGLLLMIALAFLSHGAPAADTVVRTIDPAALKGAPDVRALVRLQAIGLAKWSDEKKASQTIDVTPLDGKESNCQVRVLDLFPVADAFHFTTDPAAFRGALYTTFDVLEPANVLLSSQSGSSFWSFQNMTNYRTVVFYNGESLDVRKKGVSSMMLPFTSWKSYTGNPMTKGVYTLDNKGSFNIADADSGKNLGYCNHSGSLPKHPPCALNHADAVNDRVCFTVADLTKYTVSIGTVAGDWTRKGYVGAEVLLTDAQGDMFELAGAKVTARVSGAVAHESALMPLAARGVVVMSAGNVDYEYRFAAEYPETFYDIESIEVTASAWIMGADGILREEVVSKTVTKAESKPVELAAWLGTERRKDIRTADGTLCETRAVWIHSYFIRWWLSPAKAKLTVDKAEEMGANVMFPTIFQGHSYVPSDSAPSMAELPKQNGDEFNVLIKEAHARGIEVHPVVGCMIGGTIHSEKSSLIGQHLEWMVRDQDGNPVFDGVNYISDVHRPEFRKHLIRFIADLVKRYPVDGIHLDYNRTMQFCSCQKCRDEYHAQFGGDLLKDASAQKPSIQAWQEEAVSTLIKGIREALNAVRPGLKLSTWGTDDPGSFSLQGRRPDIWLNNGWIDWFEVGLYGDEPDPAVIEWVKQAKLVKQPDRCWPTLGMYNSSPGPTAIDLNKVTVTGSGQGESWGRKPEALIPMFESLRDRCKLNGFAFFDMQNTNDDILRGMKELILKEKAIPWYPKSGQ